jgi:hypothetical protein
MIQLASFKRLNQSTAIIGVPRTRLDLDHKDNNSVSWLCDKDIGMRICNQIVCVHLGA